MSTIPRYIPKALLRPRAKPFLIWAAPPFLALSGLTDGAFATVVAFGSQSGSAYLGDQPVSALWYLVAIYPVALLGAVVSVAAAYGLLVERPWARQLLTQGAAALLLLEVVIAQLVANLPLLVLIRYTWMAWLLLGLSFWFFYRYHPVRSYYDRLDEARFPGRSRDGQRAGKARS